MSDFIQQALSTPANDSQEWLAPMQAAGREAWSKVVFPTRKTESWKYTNLKVLEKQDFSSSSPQRVSLEKSALASCDMQGLESIDLVFVNGYFDQALSSSTESLPEGLTLSTFAQADEELRSEISHSLGSVVQNKDHIFSCLNAASLEDGVFLKVSKNTKIDTAIRVLHYSTEHQQGATVNSRIFAKLEQGAEATLVEQYASEEGSLNVFANNVTELDVAANAKLNHYRLHLESEQALHVGGVHCNLAAHATLNSFHIAYGAVLKRIDCVVNHKGEGAHCEMNGIYLPSHTQHIDYHTTIEHAVPHCTTNEVFRGIISDQAKAVFNGRIHIHKAAQKTFAQLSNKNLLTSNKAEINTKPELEIYADDVQCAHGATVAQLEEKSMHYLMTRGLSRKDARMMLSFGFINELVNQIQHEGVAEFLRPLIAKHFSRETLT